MVTTTESIGAPVLDIPEEPPAEAPNGTTRVVMAVQITGTRNGADWPAIGDVIEVPIEEAADLVRHYLAVPEVAEELPEEAAIVPEATPERAIVPKAPRKSARKGK